METLVAGSLLLMVTLVVGGTGRLWGRDRARAQDLLSLMLAGSVFFALVVLTRKNDAGLWQIQPTQHIGTMLLLGAAVVVIALDGLTKGISRFAWLPWMGSGLFLATMGSHSVNFPALRLQFERQGLSFWGTRTVPDGMHAAARRRVFCEEITALHERIMSLAPAGAVARYPELPGHYLDSLEPAMSDASLTLVLAVTRFREPVGLIRSGWETGWNAGGKVVADVAGETPSWFREALKDPEVARYYGFPISLREVLEDQLHEEDWLPPFREVATGEARELRFVLDTSDGLRKQHGLVVQGPPENGSAKEVGEGVIRFRGKGWDGWHEARLPLPGQGEIMRTTLRQSVAFNLLEEVTEVEVILPKGWKVVP